MSSGRAFLELPTVPDEQWVSRDEARSLLGMSQARIGWLISFGPLSPAMNSHRQQGLDRRSVEAELAWRRSASPAAKTWRLVRDGFLAWF